MPSAPTITTLARDGSTATPYSALDFTGIDLPNDGNTFLQLENRSATATLVGTVDALIPCEFGTDHNWAISLAPGTGVVLGPFPVNQFGAVVYVRFSAGSDAAAQFVRAYRPQRAA